MFSGLTGRRVEVDFQFRANYFPTMKILSRIQPALRLPFLYSSMECSYGDFAV